MGALFTAKEKNPNICSIKCKVNKHKLYFNQKVPNKFVDRIDDETWKECIENINDGIISINCLQLKKNSIIAKRCAITCILIFCSCFPSSIISFSSGLTYNYKPYFVAFIILFILSLISFFLFIKYSNQKLVYDNLWRIRVYNGINITFSYLNNHHILKKYISFKLSNLISKSWINSINCFECGSFIANNCCFCCFKQKNLVKQFTNKNIKIIVTLKTKYLSLPKGSIYQFKSSKQYNSCNQPLLINDNNNNNNNNDNNMPKPSAPMLYDDIYPNDDLYPNTKPKHAFNPEFLASDKEGVC